MERCEECKLGGGKFTVREGIKEVWGVVGGIAVVGDIVRRGEGGEQCRFQTTGRRVSED